MKRRPGKRNATQYLGVYHPPPAQPRVTHNNMCHIEAPAAPSFYESCFKVVSSYLWVVLASLEEHYFAVCTIVGMIILSLVLPDFSEKAHVSKKLREVQLVLDTMTLEVGRAEVACVTAAEQVYKLNKRVRDNSTGTVNNWEAPSKEMSVCTYITATKSEPAKLSKTVGFLRRVFLPCQNPSNKEIALMSYIYTHSFDVEKPEKDTPDIDTL